MVERRSYRFSCLSLISSKHLIKICVLFCERQYAFTYIGDVAGCE
jgi:hypothetical protein